MVKEAESTSTIFISWKQTWFSLQVFDKSWILLCRRISFTDSVFFCFRSFSGICISAGDYIIRVNDVTDDITAFMEVSIGFSDDLKYEVLFCEKLELICSLFSWGVNILRIKGFWKNRAPKRDSNLFHYTPESNIFADRHRVSRWTLFQQLILESSFLRFQLFVFITSENEKLQRRGPFQSSSTLPEINIIAPEKWWDWKTILSLWDGTIWGSMLNFQG